MPVGPNGLILNKNFDVTVHQFWVYGLVSVLANSHVFGGTGQLHFVYDFYYLCIKGHVSWLWFISCLTLCEKKNEACKPVISLLLFFKLGVTLLSWSLPHPWVGFSDEKEYQNRFRNTHTVQNKRNESNAVLYRSAWKKTPKRKSCEAASSSEPAALPFGHVSEINGMHSNRVQFQEDAAALMQEENKQRGACLTAPCVWLGIL